MKIRFLFAALALAFSVSAWSQLLWRVEGNGLARPSYIVGTHHIAPVGVVDSIKGLRQAVADVDAVYGEIHMDSLLSVESQQRMMRAMIAPADSTLDKVLSPADYAVVDSVVGRYLGGMGIGLKHLVNLKPVGLSTQLQALQAKMYFPEFDPNAQLDHTLQKMGRDAGKAVGGLETVGEQIHVLFDTPLSSQAEALVEMCRYDKEYKQATKELCDAYMAQDLDRAYKLLVDPEMGAKPTAEELDRLIYGRNRNWVRKLVKMMPVEPMLVAVGAGHLPGDEGLISLLRAEGYKVEPVK